jgi:predicted HD phosphohydrolase
VKLTTHLRLVPPLPQCAFMAWPSGGAQACLLLHYLPEIMYCDIWGFHGDENSSHGELRHHVVIQQVTKVLESLGASSFWLERLELRGAHRYKTGSTRRGRFQSATVGIGGERCSFGGHYRESK